MNISKRGNKSFNRWVFVIAIDTDINQWAIAAAPRPPHSSTIYNEKLYGNDNQSDAYMDVEVWIIIEKSVVDTLTRFATAG